MKQSLHIPKSKTANWHWGPTLIKLFWFDLIKQNVHCKPQSTAIWGQKSGQKRGKGLIFCDGICKGWCKGCDLWSSQKLPLFQISSASLVTHDFELFNSTLGTRMLGATLLYRCLGWPHIAWHVCLVFDESYKQSIYH